MAGDVKTENLIQGPAEIYFGAVGAVEPATPTTAIDEEVWTFGGSTRGGVTLNTETEWAELESDQLTSRPGQTLVSRNHSIATELGEVTLENYAIALNAAAPAAAVAGVQELTLDEGLSAMLAPYRAVLLRGPGPGGKTREVIIRRALSTESVESAYQKDGQQVIPITLASHYVSGSIAAMRMRDGAPAA